VSALALSCAPSFAPPLHAVSSAAAPHVRQMLTRMTASWDVEDASPPRAGCAGADRCAPRAGRVAMPCEVSRLSRERASHDTLAST
jgi:hypothetical protein